MIVAPSNKEQFQIMASFLLHHAKVQPSPDMKLIAWWDDAAKELKVVVGLDSFIGKTCQIHVAMVKDYAFTPRALLDVVFDYAFNALGREMLLGTVNSRNVAAIRYDKHLGFVENHRIPGMHEDGGDIVLMSMLKEQCRYLKQKEAA